MLLFCCFMRYARIMCWLIIVHSSARIARTLATPGPSCACVRRQRNKSWRTGALAHWRTGALAHWRIGAPNKNKICRTCEADKSLFFYFLPNPTFNLIFKYDLINFFYLFSG